MSDLYVIFVRLHVLIFGHPLHTYGGRESAGHASSTNALHIFQHPTWHRLHFLRRHAHSAHSPWTSHFLHLRHI